MKYRLFYKAAALAIVCASTGACTERDYPSDRHATMRTVNLYNDMKDLVGKGVMLGHQDALAYGRQNYAPGESDVEKMTGDYPAVVGWDLGHLELGSDRNLDSVYFSAMKDGVKQVDAMGGINTFSWHADNILTGGSTWDCERTDVVASVLPGGENHDEYQVWLGRLASFFLSLKDGKGDNIPVILRLYHEHTGSWFWWGQRQCSAEQYIALWHLTADYFRNNGVHNILYAYSPSDCRDSSEYFSRYPGDEYVDIIGFDIYQNGNDTCSYIESMNRNMDIIGEYAEKSGKIPAVSETGSEGVSQSDYFTSVIYPLIKDRRMSYILFWRNAYEPEKPGHFYLPYKGHQAAVDFASFVSSREVLMAGDVAAMRH